jgi:hypothetical protein
MEKENAFDVEPLIHVVRGQRVIIDVDLARVYGVPTKVFNQAVKRNVEKFPADFMFSLMKDEADVLLRSRSQSVALNRSQIVTGYRKHKDANLRSQIVTSSSRHGGRRYLPLTESYFGNNRYTHN